MEGLILANKRFVKKREILPFLNAWFISNIDVPEQVMICDIQNPKQLILHPKRFDLICKYIYVKYKDLGIKRIGTYNFIKIILVPFL